MTDTETTARTIAALPETTVAVTAERYGEPGAVIEIAEVPVPAPSPTQVLLRVRAAGLDRGTWHLVTGRPYLGRLVFGLRRPSQPVLGLDVAGTVVAVGSEVTEVAPGDEVFGIGTGTFAGLAVAEADKLVRRPSGVDAEAAAAAPVSGITALQAVTDVGRLEAGQRVLVIGASGGVGSFAVQIAKALGAHVTGTASPARQELVRSLGADRVLGHDEAVNDGSRYDLVLDIGGNRPLRHLRRLLSERGTLVIVGGEEGNRLTGGICRNLRAVAWSAVIRQRMTFFISGERAEDISRLGALMADGSVRSAVTARIGLADVAEALDDMTAGRSGGKTVVVPGLDG